MFLDDLNSDSLDLASRLAFMGANLKMTSINELAKSSIGFANVVVLAIGVPVKHLEQQGPVHV